MSYRRLGSPLVRALMALILSSAVIPLAAPVAYAQSGPITRSDYDSVPVGSDEYLYWYPQVKSPSRISYLADPVGQRGVVQRVDVEPGDNGVAMSASNVGERAEVMRNGDLNGFMDGQTIVISWSVFVDSYFSSPLGQWNNFVQIHDGGGVGQSPWQLNLVGDQAELKMRIFGGGTWSASEQPAGSVSEWLSLGFLPKNQWNDFVSVVRFGCAGNGYAKLWRNGELLVDAESRKIGYCGDPGTYWKQGFYRSAHPKTTRLWFDDTFRWASAEDAFTHYGWSV